MPNSIIFFVVLLAIWLGLAVFENAMLAKRRGEARRVTEEFFNNNH